MNLHEIGKTQTQRSVILIWVYYPIWFFFMFMNLYKNRKSEENTIKLIVPH